MAEAWRSLSWMVPLALPPCQQTKTSLENLNLTIRVCLMPGGGVLPRHPGRYHNWLPLPRLIYYGGSSTLMTATSLPMTGSRGRLSYFWRSPYCVLPMIRKSFVLGEGTCVYLRYFSCRSQNGNGLQLLCLNENSDSRITMGYARRKPVTSRSKNALVWLAIRS